MVHSSLSRLGYVAGGAHAVVLALLDAVGPDGTIVMPTHSGDLSDPATLEQAPVPEAWWDTIRSAMPAFDPVLTPTRRMGAIVECFRRLPDVPQRASDHLDRRARPAGHDHHRSPPLAFGLGEASPLARLYELDADVVLLGVDHANNTSLHLAEYRADYPNKAWTVTHASPVLIDGHRSWTTYDDLEADDSDFVPLGESFASTGKENRGVVGAGVGRIMRRRDIVDYAVDWMEGHRV